MHWSVESSINETQPSTASALSADFCSTGRAYASSSARSLVTQELHAEEDASQVRHAARMHLSNAPGATSSLRDFKRSQVPAGQSVWVDRKTDRKTAHGVAASSER